MTGETDSKVASGPSNLDEVRQRVRAQAPAQVHAVRSKMIGAYTAFVAATLIASITNSVAIGGGSW
ncbi:hypothetical protein OKW42_004487 [Paraburkholderia sp. WC7.3d]